jgi:branched-chain amino acid transport system substrate-binding protein
MSRALLSSLLAGLILLSPCAVRAQALQDIHVLSSLSGSGAFLGKQSHDTLLLAEKYLNDTGDIHGKKLRFVFHDDQSNPQIAVQLLGEVMAARPAVIMGSNIVATCSAMQPLLAQGPLAYCFSAGQQPPRGSFMLSAGASTLSQTVALVRYFRLKGWTRLALLSSTDASGQDGDRNMAETLALPENKDMKLVVHPHFNLSDVSVAAQIEQVRAASPQALIAWTIGTPAATIFRGYAQAGLAMPVGSSGGNMTYAQMKQFASFLPKALYLVNTEWTAAGDARLKLDGRVAAAQKIYYAAMDAAGRKPDAAAVVSWDPALLLAGALEALPDGASAEAVRSHLAHFKGAGVHGVYDFEKEPQRGIGTEDVIVTRWAPDQDRWLAVSQPGGTPLE